LIPIINGGRYLVEDLALQYKVEPFQIQRDLEIAFICGLPGYTPDILIDLSLEDGFIEILNPLVLEKPRAISFQDIVSISMGLEILKSSSKHLDINIVEIDKLHSKLKNSLTLIPIISIENESIRKLLEIVSDSISEKRAISFDYIDSSGRKSKRRKVRASKVIWHHSNPMLQGFDFEKRGVRIFNIARMDKMAQIDISEEPGNLPSSSIKPREIKVRISLSEKWWLLRFPEFIDGSLQIESDTCIFTLKYWERSWLIRILAPVSDKINFPDLDQQENASLWQAIRSYLLEVKG
jgi:predicted DNA-binding transcriptional regulator YafY